MSLLLKRPLGAILFALCGAFAGFADAQEYRLAALTIDHPFARATPPGATSGGVYFAIVNRGADADNLVSASSPVAGGAEVHTMTMEGTLMRMRPYGPLAIPRGATVALRPGGVHVMLLNLKRPLVAGETIPLRLTFEKAGTIEVAAAVIPFAPGAGRPADRDPHAASAPRK